jgi:uncharacterized protein YjiS (DUF1127 family)
MMSRDSILERSVPSTSGQRNSLVTLAQRMALNCRRWLINRRELRYLETDQLRDVGLSREAVEQACWLNLLQS